MSGVIKINTISELTTDAGVSIEGVTLKDNGITLIGAVNFSYLETGDKLAYFDTAKDLAPATISSNLTLTTGTLDTVQDIQTTSAVTFASITLTSGGTANEVSTDGTLSGNSDSAIPTEKAVKTYVDTFAQGVKWKASVLAATTANITLTNTQTVDGISLVAGDRVLVKNQTTVSENGIYIVVDAGAWTRSNDSDAWTEIISMAIVIETGTVNADTMYICNVDAGGVLDTTDITFTKMSSITTHNNLTGIQGGTTDEYYHLTSAQHTELTAWTSTVTLGSNGDVDLTTGDLIATYVTGTTGMYTNSIVEYTTDNGVSIEGMNIKSNGSTLVDINVPTGYTYSFKINGVEVLAVS
jgi:hypothetical protein